MRLHAGGGHCALCAPTAFSVRIKVIRTENAVTVNSRKGLGFYPRSSIARGCAFHPCAIDDPRGRAAVRASSITAASLLRRRANGREV
jgi:hypothetical protein